MNKWINKWFSNIKIVLLKKANLILKIYNIFKNQLKKRLKVN